jgi:N-acetyl-gamma-glutamyl-phosphate/LysW-gamma-L-alpha-aminoadipyl-6-phosphate reductase
MRDKITAAIVGASGYVGGEALRILLDHPDVEVVQATSESNLGKYVHAVHPNLRKKTELKFSSMNTLQNVDVLFLGLPHGLSSKHMESFMAKAGKIIDKGSDFRLNNAMDYVKYYGEEHPNPELIKRFVYGIPELHRAEIKEADYVAAAGCNATATILPLYPLYKEGLVIPDRTVVEVKAGSSQGGSKVSDASHHPERRDCLRSYAPTGHRHVAEILQELMAPSINFSATSVDLVRGILATSHVFLNQRLENKDLWRIYRKYYGQEPFVRIVKEASGIYRYPEPKILAGSNYCDIGFELDEGSNRLVVMSAIDNLMKGAAGQAVQCMNIMMGFDEKAGLGFPGLHPV